MILLHDAAIESVLSPEESETKGGRPNVLERPALAATYPHRAAALRKSGLVLVCLRFLDHFRGLYILKTLKGDLIFRRAESGEGFLQLTTCTRSC